MKGRSRTCGISLFCFMKQLVVKLNYSLYGIRIFFYTQKGIGSSLKRGVVLQKCFEVEIKQTIL
jgi:hypothetical protein